jgi:hypothetical protein
MGVSWTAFAALEAFSTGVSGRAEAFAEGGMGA